MKWVPDKTGRLPKRPHFDPQELDFECERIVSEFVRRKYDSVKYPLNTNDLVLLVERESSDLDVYADLSGEGDDVEGVTEFVRGNKPRVRVSHLLSEDPRRENRYRTTLAHEFGHAKFHMPLFAVMSKQAKLIQDVTNSFSPRCRRESILHAPSADWMEWQAGYISGAILMPATPLKKIASDVIKDANVFGPQPKDSVTGRALTLKVQTAFQVSADAAVVRLSQLRYLGNAVASQSLLPSS